MQTDDREGTASSGAEGIPGMLMRRTTYLLARGALSAKETLNARLAVMGLHVRHFAVLTMLLEMPAAQVEMADRLCIDRTSMVKLLDELEAMGLVRRTTHPRDRRMHVVEMTARGVETAQEANRCAEDAEAELLAPLTEHERKQLHKLLEKLVGQRM